MTASSIDFDGDIYGEPVPDVDFRPRLPRTKWGWRRIMRQMVQEQILTDNVREEKTMTRTSHGHHIPGSPDEIFDQSDVVKCGGIGICSDCDVDVEHFTLRKTKSYTALKPRAVELGRRAQDLENAMLWDEYKASRKKWLEFLEGTDVDLRIRLSKVYWLERDRGLTGE